MYRIDSYSSTILIHTLLPQLAAAAALVASIHLRAIRMYEASLVELRFPCVML